MDQLRKLATSISSALERFFGFYGGFVYGYPYIVIIFSVALACGLGYGFTMYQEETETINLWIPKDAESISNSDTLKEAFPYAPEDQKIYAISKIDGGNLITKEAFSEIIEFEEKLWKDFLVDNMNFNDVCYKATSTESNVSACERNSYPLMFFLKADASFDRSSLVSTDTLVDKINSGKGTTDFYPEGTALYIPCLLYTSPSPRDS